MKNTKKNQDICLDKVKNMLKLGGKSDKTFDNYKSNIIRFFNYFDKNVDIDKISEEEICNFFIEKHTNKNRSFNTLNVAICSIRFMYDVCFNRYINRRLLPSCKIIKRLPTILEKETFLKIFNNENNIKHKCWLILGFCSGLRVEEIATIRIEDIFSSNHKLKVLGKGKKERYTILPDCVIKFLRLYYKSNNLKDKKGYLFKGTSNKEHMNCKTIINYFSVLKDDYNLNDNISFHSLRHSFATYYLMNGGSLLTLQSMLGHTNLNTTTIYLHLAQDFNQLEGIKYV